MVKVAVILVHYFNFDDTEACVESILCSQPSDGIRIYIADNSVPADNRLLVLQERHECVRLLTLGENMGFSRANNRCIQMAERDYDPDYYFVLNNDTLIRRDTIKELTEVCSRMPQIGISTCPIFYADEPSRIWYGGGEINLRKGWPEIRDFDRTPTPEGAGKSGEVGFASGCAMMFSRQAMKKIGGFDESFFMYVEDMELCLRARKLGISIYYSAATQILHRVHGAASEQGKYKNVHPRNPNLEFLYLHLRRNQYQTMARYLKGREFFYFALFFWTKFMYTLFIMVLRGRLNFIRIAWKTFLAIIRSRKEMRGA